MTDMQKIEFSVGAKAARLIGRENIADVDGALIELIKNAYDADASCVWIYFYMPFPDVPTMVDSLDRFVKNLSEDELKFVLDCYETEDDKLKKKASLSEAEEAQLRGILFAHNKIIVADNGCGMTADTVKSAWMHIGTSNKEYDIRSDKGRVKTGAKGIGRFALDKLSVKSVVYTKAKASETVVRWSMDWDQFASAKLINEVKAELEEQPDDYEQIVAQVTAMKERTMLEEHDWATGTMIILSPVREAWSGRLFQKVNTNLKSINPIGSVDRFDVIVNNAFYPEYCYKTEKVAIDPKDYDYRILAQFDGQEMLKIKLLRNEVNLSKRKITVEMYGASSTRQIEEFWSREAFQRDGYQKADYDKERIIEKKIENIIPPDELEKARKIGPFTAEMYFLRNANNEYDIMKRVTVGDRKRLLNQFSGVKLYRDDFKVRPYGDEGALYDWLGMGVRAQKSPASISHPSGAWRVQPYQMIGLVKIGREANPYLEDMANREGIALTDTYYIFVELLQECLKEFEFDRQYIYREYARWIKSIEEELSDYTEKVKQEAARREEERRKKQKEERDSGNKEKEPADNQSPDADENQENDFSEDEMFDTVYKMMQDSERELNSKQILQILSSSGIVLNTFFHEFNAINTQFHVRASQIRSRVRHILKGQEYTGIAAYNPYPWIDALEKTDRVTAAFLDVVMEGLKKESLKRQEISMQKVIRDILEKWSLLLEEKHIVIRPDIFAEKELDDRIQMAVVDMYIILNNFLLNAAWFLEREHNPKREIAFTLEESADMLYLYMENNGPCLDEKFKDNPDKIFEMGETSKEDAKTSTAGTGLGLWVVKETVERYNGVLSVMDKKDGFGLRIAWKKPERRT